MQSPPCDVLPNRIRYTSARKKHFISTQDSILITLTSSTREQNTVISFEASRSVVRWLVSVMLVMLSCLWVGCSLSLQRKLIFTRVIATQRGNKWAEFRCTNENPFPRTNSRGLMRRRLKRGERSGRDDKSAHQGRAASRTWPKKHWHLALVQQT